VCWREAPDQKSARTAYSDQSVILLDAAAALASVDASPMSIPHVLVCVAEINSGVMDTLRRDYGIKSASWRAALAGMPTVRPRAAGSSAAAGRPYVTPEEAAAYLGVHVQTIRGYIRNGKLPALRIAGERAIRLRREDLDELLEPLQAHELDKPNQP